MGCGDLNPVGCEGSQSCGMWGGGGGQSRVGCGVLNPMCWPIRQCHNGHIPRHQLGIGVLLKLQ